MTSADVQLIDRIRLQKHVPRAGCFEVWSSPITFIAHTKYLKAYGSSNHHYFVGSMKAPSKAFPLFFLLSDCLKLNHLKSRMECCFSDIFSRYICSTVAETIGVTNYAARFGTKKCSENHI